MLQSGSQSFSLRVAAAGLAIGFSFFASQALACLPVRAHIRVGADTAHCQANDIQSAINAAGSCPVVIDITKEHTYTDQHLSISGKNITFQGWGDGVTCADIPDELSFPPYTPPVSNVPLVTLNGSGGGRVFSITGTSNVGLRNVGITGGLTDDTATGGGIDFYGQGSLYLVYSVVNLNQAGYGAGINMNGVSGLASLTLDTYSQIIVNTATHSGGGIRILGQSRLYALKPQTLIGFNHADNGYGGGIEVLAPARADIGSSGFGGLGVIHGNSAGYGGGIDVLTFQGGQDAIVRLFSTDATSPVQISDNFASHTGGAFYLKPRDSLTEGFGQAFLCANDFRINGNVAQEGSAIYSDADHDVLGGSAGGSVELNTDVLSNCSSPELPSVLGAVACADGVACNEFTANSAEDANGNPTAGSTIFLQNDSSMDGDRFSARNNKGAHVLGQIDSSTYVTNCLIVDNMLTQELIAGDGETFLGIYSCTIAGNQIGAPFTLLSPSTALYNSIIDQPGRGTVDPSITDARLAAYVLATDRNSLPDSVYIVQGEPTFIDASHGNYHLTSTSLGVDFAPTPDPSLYNSAYLESVTRLDRDLKSRVVDLPDTSNNFGPMDLGAYEMQQQFACGASDTIFCDGFESQ